MMEVSSSQQDAGTQLITNIYQHITSHTTYIMRECDYFSLFWRIDERRKV